MELPEKKCEAIVAFSLDYLGRQWSEDFNCIAFVREIYKMVDIEIPPIHSHILPPRDFNITEENLNSWRAGYILFLKRQKYTGERIWTHVGITLPEEKLIHCSEYFGRQVSITPKKEIFSFYHYVPSRGIGVLL